jgi:hypothetical protein
MVARDQDVRERLVVAQQHVVPRLQLLDQVLFKQQRLGFRPRRQEHHRRGLMDHPGDPRAVALRLGIVRHPLLQVARLADVQNRALVIEHPVHARRPVQPRHLVGDQGVTGRPGRVPRRIPSGCVGRAIHAAIPSGAAPFMPGCSRGNKSTKPVDKSGDKVAGRAENLLYPARFAGLPNF